MPAGRQTAKQQARASPTMPRRNSRNSKDRRNDKLRRLVTLEAAKMMYDRTEKEYFTAKRKASRRMGINFRYHPSGLPSNREIREEILQVADLYEGDERQHKLREMRLYALWLMKYLETFSPKLIGSTLTGHIRKGSDIDIHIFCDSLSPVTQTLENHGLPYHVEKKRIVKYNKEREFTHVHVHGRFEAELTVYSMEYLHYCFKSSITGKPIEKTSIKELALLLAQEYAGIDLEEELRRFDAEEDCYEMFKLLLLPLENLDGGSKHPEGDALYHSLQVFELARREEYACDVEFLQAALLHDVGKAIDFRNHAEAGADALEGFVSPRVCFLIRYHMEALSLLDGTLGHKKSVYLRHHEFYEDLLLLRSLDTQGRKRGVIVDTLDESLEYLKKLESGDLD